MKLTTIQMHEDTKKKLEQRKKHPRESYEEVIKRILEEEEIPSMEEMFREADKMKQDRMYTTEEIVKMTHELRGKG